MFSLGDKVCSLKGRDAEKCFLVVEIIDEQYVLIADGKHHRAEKPKKKKIKHLKLLCEAEEEIKQKLENKIALTNPMLQKALKINANKGEE